MNDAIVAAWAKGIKPPPIYDPASWAAAERWMTSAETSKPGWWDNDYTPYGVEPMRRMSLNDPTQRIVLMFCAQLIKTEILNNMIGYVAKCHPRRVMMVMPTQDMAERHSKLRIAPMFESPTFAGLISPARSRDSGNTLTLKEFPGGALMMTGANSPAMARSWPMGVLLCDEISVWPDSLGGEGSPLHLFRIRLSSYGNQAKEVDTSTPGTKGKCAIEREFNQSSRAYYHVPCPLCGEFQTLQWPNLKYDGEPGRDGFSVWYECEHCHGAIHEHQKTEMFKRGVWIHEDPDNPVKGYHLNALYMPVGRTDWMQLVTEWKDAMARVKVGDSSLLQVFINTRLAQTFEDRGERVDPASLEGRCEVYPDPLPVEIRAITVGVDVQDARLECEVVGWGAGFESWSLAYHVIQSDPLDRQTWLDLDKILQRQWPRADGATLPVSAACIDSGYRTQAVHDFVKPRMRRRVYAIKGLPGPGRTIWDKKVRRSGKNKDRGVFFGVGVDNAKDTIAAYLRIKEPGPGYCHFPEGRLQTVPDYFAMLTSEKRVTVKDRKGREHYEWHKPTESTRNEALDCRVYALAALHSLMVAGMRLDPTVQPTKTPRPPVAPERAEQPAIEGATAPVPPAAPRRSAVPPRTHPHRPGIGPSRGQGWISGRRR